MGDDRKAFDEAMKRHAAAIEALARRGISLAPAFPPGEPSAGAAALVDATFASEASARVEPYAVIDLSRAAVAWEALGRAGDAESVARALLRGRVRLQGTDGVRGPVALSSPGDPVEHFARTSEITPDFLRVLCYAFARLAAGQGLAAPLDKVVLANDGRDEATGWRLLEAAKEGLAAGGLQVLDLGVAPTPAVPFVSRHRGIRLGAAITASHNPSDQNGIKFFIDGWKMLPEGPLGDYALTAAAIEASRAGVPRATPVVEDGSGLIDEFAEFIVSNLPAGADEALKGLDIVFDTANGAGTRAAKLVAQKLGLDVTLVNAAPTGANINQGGGVAELEGRDSISRAEAESNRALSAVAALLERSRRTGRRAQAIILDGDGDRGYVVITEDGESALVVDGDAEAFVIARWMRKSGDIPHETAASHEFVGTVESDIELFRAVRDRLGLAASVSAVGDKWLVAPYRAGRRLAVGEEFSGHVLWPAIVETPSGPDEVLSGSGILTGLATLAAASALGLSGGETARPFPKGAFITRYTYNVNKSLFFPGSAAWAADVECIKLALGAAPRTAFAGWRFVERGDEPDMLYAELADYSGAVAGAVFVRNSGTENKTCVYARGTKALEPVLGLLCDALWRSHRKTMKDPALAAVRLEEAVLTALAGGPVSREALPAALGAAGTGISAQTLDSVLYGMRKERLIDVSADGFSLGKQA